MCASAASFRDFESWARFIAEDRHSPEALEKITGVPAADVRAAARLYATGGNGAIYYGLGVTEHSQGSTMVMGMANLAMATGNIGRVGVGRESAARPEQRAGRVRHGLVPARVPRLPPRLRRRDAAQFEALWGLELSGEPGLRIPNMLDEAVVGKLQGPLRAGRGHRAVRSRHAARHRRASRRWNASSCRTSS